MEFKADVVGIFCAMGALNLTSRGKNELIRIKEIS